jgi:hypothetical protein
MTEEQLEQLKGKKFVRTTMFVDGTNVSARLTLATSEIKPHPYKTGKSMPKASWNGVEDGDPAWARIPAPVWVDKSLPAKSIRKTKSNPNNIYLEEFMTLEEATEALPILDNLMVGSTSLGDGNKDTINKGVLFCMLRDLDEINAQTIQEYTGHSMSHCWRLAQYLRVLSKAFDMEVNSQDNL